MALSKHGRYGPQKSPYNFETYESHLEELYMMKLDSDPVVAKWLKRHGISIPWIDVQMHQRRYRPDFLVEFTDGRIAIVEVKDPSRVDSPEVLRKRKAAEIWCKRRGIEYSIATI